MISIIYVYILINHTSIFSCFLLIIFLCYCFLLIFFYFYVFVLSGGYGMLGQAGSGMLRVSVGQRKLAAKVAKK
jgi:hypothetical protein